MDRQGAQIAVAAFADAEQAGSPSTRSLLGYEAQPRRKLATILEAGSVPHGRNQCRRRHRANAFDLPKPLALLAVAEDFPYPPLIGCYSPIELGHFRLQFPHERPNQVAAAVIAAADNLSEAASQLWDVTGNDSPMLGGKTTDLIDESDPIGNQTPANAMNGLHRQLIGRFLRNKTH
jgi:hypothetical protein